jgi:hypothetical protein
MQSRLFDCSYSDGYTFLFGTHPMTATLVSSDARTQSYFCGPTAKRGPRLPHCWSLKITHRHTHPVGLLSTSDQLVAEPATYTTHNKHKIWKFMSSAGFAPAILTIEQPQNYALDRTAIGIGRTFFYVRTPIINYATFLHFQLQTFNNVGMIGTCLVLNY